MSLYGNDSDQYWYGSVAGTGRLHMTLKAPNIYMYPQAKEYWPFPDIWADMEHHKASASTVGSTVSNSRLDGRSKHW